MKFIHIGDRGSQAGWERAVRARGGSFVTERPGADVAICSGRPVAESIDALASGLAVIAEEPKASSAADLHALATAASRPGRLHWFRARDDRYAAVEKLVRRYIGSGRLGHVGHVSCIDHRSVAASASTDRRFAQLVGHAAGDFGALQRLFGPPRMAMARLSATAAHFQSTAAFLSFADGLHVQYFGSIGPGKSTNALWIEGSGGSLKTDGRIVLWRKRGWRFFAPIRWSLPAGGDDLVIARAAAVHRAGTPAGDAPAQSHSVAATLAAVAESDERCRVVQIARSGE
jgi:predicted dehydrogenase